MCGKWQVVCMLLVMSLLCGCSSEIHTSVSALPEPEQLQSVVSLSFPITMANSTLVIEEMMNYYGSYWEDGSGDLVEGVAGLMIYNPTDRMIEFASFVVRQAEESLYFFVHHLPPMSRCLVLEYKRMPCQPQDVTECREICVRWDYQELSREQVDYVGLGPLMTIINRDGRTIDHVTVRYKQYVKEGDYYLGGVVYSAHLFFLQPEERRTIQPEHYKAGYARIVAVELEG